MMIKEGFDNTNDLDSLVDFFSEICEYLYDWCQTYTGKYNYVDHSKWIEKCMILLQKYRFDINKIKEDIINGTIILSHYSNDNPKLKAIEQQLYYAHKKKVEEFENKVLNDEQFYNTRNIC